MKFANGVKKFLGQALGETAPNGKEGSDATRFPRFLLAQVVLT